MSDEPTASKPDINSPAPQPEGEPERTQDETPRSTWQPNRRLGLPAWTLGLLVLALTAVLIWAGNAYLRSRQQFPVQEPPPPTATIAPSTTPTPARTKGPTTTPVTTPVTTPTPTEPDVTLILVAEIYSLTSGAQPDPDLTRRLYETLVARIEQEGLQGQVRAERLETTIADADAARAAGHVQNAGFVLWNSVPEEVANTTVQRISLTRVNARPQTRTTPRGYDLTLNVLSQHEFQASSPEENWMGGAVDVFLALAAYGHVDLGEDNPLWHQALSAAQEAEVSELTSDLLLYRGNARAFGDNYDGALAEYDAAIESASNAATAYANRGAVRLAQGGYEAALDDLNQALELAPDLANAYYNRANAYRALEQPDQALADLDRALELDPQHARAHASRGLIRHNAGEHEAALEDYTRAVELSPKAADVYLNRGGTYATLGLFEAAIEDYTRALELTPNDADAYYNRGTVYAMIEQYDRALADLDRALSIKPDFEQIYGNRGLVYKAMGEREKALADLKRFLELSENPEWRQLIEQQLAELESE